MSVPMVSASSNQGYVDTRNSGFSPYDAVNIEDYYEWSYNSGHYLVKGSPAINSTGYAFFSTGDGHVFCVSPTGSMVWEHDTGTSYDTSCQIVTDETRDAVFFSHDARVGVNCIYMNNGTLKWQSGVIGGGSTWYGDMATTDSFDYIFIVRYAGASGSLFKVNKTTGSLTLFSGSISPGNGNLKPLINISDGSVITQYKGATGAVICYDSTGTQLWFKNPISANSTNFGNMVMSNTGFIYALEHGSPNKIYQFYANNGTMATTKIVGYTIPSEAIPVIGIGGLDSTFRLFVPSANGNINPYNSSLVQAETTQVLGGNITGMSQSSDGILFVYNDNHYLYAIDVVGTSTGELWNIHLGYFSGVGCPVLASDNILYAFGDYLLYKLLQGTPIGITLSITGYGTVNNPYVDLAWTYPTSNGSGGDVLFYLVYCSIDGTTFYNISWTDNLTRTYTDSTIAKDLRYYYYVLGHNAVGNGAPSNIVSINIILGVGVIIVETGIIGQMLPFIITLFMSLFVSIIYQKRFSLSMFLICLGMMMAVMIWLKAIPVFGLGMIVLLYSSVIWMAYSQSGGATNE